MDKDTIANGLGQRPDEATHKSGSKSRARLQKSGGDQCAKGPHEHTIGGMAVNMKHLSDQRDIDPEYPQSQ